MEINTINLKGEDRRFLFLAPGGGGGMRSYKNIDKYLSDGDIKKLEDVIFGRISGCELCVSDKVINKKYIDILWDYDFDGGVRKIKAFVTTCKRCHFILKDGGKKSKEDNLESHFNMKTVMDHWNDYFHKIDSIEWVTDLSLLIINGYNLLTPKRDIWNVYSIEK